MNEPLGFERSTRGTHDEIPSSEDGIRPPPPSPLSGGYLLIVISEPRVEAHKEVILQKISKAFLSWDVNVSGIDIEHELALVTALSPEGDIAKSGERLIQNASENLVTEILIKPQINTLRQCIRNLLSSFTKYRYIIHAGYAFHGNGSWILEDGTFSMGDFIDAFFEAEVQRVMRAYEKAIKVDVCCTPEGSWNQGRINQEPFSRLCQIDINPNNKLSSVNAAIREFAGYLDAFIVAQDICDILQSSDVVGNIRFSRPTLYIFPGGDGDTALFGINGFNMLVDGGFNRQACFWNFVRHLDRLDAVLFTRINNTNIGGMSGIVQRKVKSPVYPQVGHFFSNIQRSKNSPSLDGNKDKDHLLIDLIEEGDQVVVNLKKLQLKPHYCYRESNNEPINLYHKVGHGKLDMYILSPAKDSREVKEFLHRWHNHDIKLFSGGSTSICERELSIPIQNLVSICALLVWQPANPEDHVTRILFPGSAPQHKIMEGLDRMKQANFLKSPVCLMKSILPASQTGTTIKSMKIKKSTGERLGHTVPLPPEKIIPDNDSKKITSEMTENEISSYNHKKTSNITKQLSQKPLDKAPVSNQTKGIDIKEKNIITSTEKSPTKDTEKPTDLKITESRSTTSDLKKPEKKMAKKDEKKTKISIPEKKTESVKSSPTTPKRAVTSKETAGTDTSIKKTTTNSNLQTAIKVPPKISSTKRLKEENNRRMAETKQETKVTQSKSLISTIEGTSSTVTAETNKVIKKEPSRPKTTITATKQTPASNAAQLGTPPAITKKSIAPNNRKIEEQKRMSKVDDQKNKVTKKYSVTDATTKDVAVKKSVKGILNKKVIQNTDTDSSQSAMTISKIIRKEVEDNEDEILIIETTEMKPKDAVQNIYEDSKYLRDEKESEKGTSKDKEKNDEIEAVEKCDSHKVSSEIKSAPVPLTPEQKEDISGQLQGIISAATELVSSSIDSQTKQETTTTELSSTPMEPSAEASPVDAPPVLGKHTDTRKQEIEEKYNTEDIKEKSPATEEMSPIGHQEEESGKDKVAALKTPDEVADLPIHEEADIEDTFYVHQKTYDDDRMTEEPIVAQVVELQLPEVVTITPTSSPDENIENICKEESAIPADITLQDNLRIETSALPSLHGEEHFLHTITESENDASLQVQTKSFPIIEMMTTGQEDDTLGEKIEVSCPTNIHFENQNNETKLNNEGQDKMTDSTQEILDEGSPSTTTITSQKQIASINTEITRKISVDSISANIDQKDESQDTEMVEKPKSPESTLLYRKKSLSSPAEIDIILPVVKKTETVTPETHENSVSFSLKTEPQTDIIVEDTKITEETTDKAEEEKADSCLTTALHIDGAKTTTQESLYSQNENKNTIPLLGIKSECKTTEKQTSSSPVSAEKSSESIYEEDFVEYNTERSSFDAVKTQSSSLETTQTGIESLDVKPLQLSNKEESNSALLISHTEIISNVEDKLKDEDDSSSLPVLNISDIETNISQLSPSTYECAEPLSLAAIPEKEIILESTETEIKLKENAHSAIHQNNTSSLPTTKSETEYFQMSKSSDKESSEPHAIVVCEENISSENAENIFSLKAIQKDSISLGTEPSPSTTTTSQNSAVTQDTLMTSEEEEKEVVESSEKNILLSSIEKSKTQSTDKKENLTSTASICEKDCVLQTTEKIADTMGLQEVEKSSTTITTVQDDDKPLADEFKKLLTLQSSQDNSKSLAVDEFKNLLTLQSSQSFEVESSPLPTKILSKDEASDTAHMIEEEPCSVGLSATQSKDITSVHIGAAEIGISKPLQSLDKEGSYSSSVTALEKYNAYKSDTKYMIEEEPSSVYLDPTQSKDITSLHIGAARIDVSEPLQSLDKQGSYSSSVSVLEKDEAYKLDIKHMTEEEPSSICLGLTQSKDITSLHIGAAEIDASEPLQSLDKEGSYSSSVTVLEKDISAQSIENISSIQGALKDEANSSENKQKSIGSVTHESALSPDKGEKHLSQIITNNKDVTSQNIDNDIISEKMSELTKEVHSYSLASTQNENQQAGEIERTTFQSSEQMKSTATKQNENIESEVSTLEKLRKETVDNISAEAEETVSPAPQISYEEETLLSKVISPKQDILSQNTEVKSDIKNKMEERKIDNAGAAEYSKETTSDTTIQKLATNVKSSATKGDSISQETNMSLDETMQTNSILSGTKSTSDSKYKLEIALPRSIEGKEEIIIKTTSLTSPPSPENIEVMIKEEGGILEKECTPCIEHYSQQAVENISINENSSTKIEKSSTEDLQAEIESGVKKTDPNYVSDISIKNFSMSTVDDGSSKTELLDYEIQKNPSLGEVSHPADCIMQDIQKLRKESSDVDKNMIIQEHIKSAVSVENDAPLQNENFTSLNVHQSELDSTTNVLRESTPTDENIGINETPRRSLCSENSKDEETDSPLENIEQITLSKQTLIITAGTGEIDKKLKDEKLQISSQEKILEKLEVKIQEEQKDDKLIEPPSSLDDCHKFSTLTTSSIDSSKFIDDKIMPSNEGWKDTSSSKPTLEKSIPQTDGSTKKSPKLIDSKMFSKSYSLEEEQEKDGMEKLLESKYEKEINPQKSSNLSANKELSKLESIEYEAISQKTSEKEFHKIDEQEQSSSYKYSLKDELEERNLLEKLEEYDEKESIILSEVSSLSRANDIDSTGDREHYFQSEAITEFDKEVEANQKVIGDIQYLQEVSKSTDEVESRFEEANKSADRKFSKELDISFETSKIKETNELEPENNDKVEIIEDGSPDKMLKEEIEQKSDNDELLSENAAKMNEKLDEIGEDTSTISKLVPVISTCKESKVEDDLKSESTSHKTSHSLQEINVDKAIKEPRDIKFSLASEEKLLGMVKSTQDSESDKVIENTMVITESSKGFSHVAEKHSEGSSSMEDIARKNAVPDIKLVVEKTGSTEECELPTTITIASTTTITTIFKPEIDKGDNSAENNLVSSIEKEKKICNILPDVSTTSHSKSDNTISSKKLSTQESSSTEDIYSQNSQDMTSTAQGYEKPLERRTSKEDDCLLNQQRIENIENSSMSYIHEHDQSSIVKRDEEQQIKSQWTSSEDMISKENIQLIKTTAEIHIQDQDLISRHTIVTQEEKLDTSSRTNDSKEMKSSLQDKESIQFTSTPPLTSQDHRSISTKGTEEEFRDAYTSKTETQQILLSSTMTEGDSDIEVDDSHQRTMISNFPLTSSKVEEQIEDRASSITSMSNDAEERMQCQVELQIDPVACLSTTKITSTPVNESISELQETEEGSSTAHQEVSSTSHQEVLSPALQLDASALCVKFTSAIVESMSQKNVRIENTDEKKKLQTPILSSKANSEDIIMVSENLDTKVERKDSVAKTISLPILDTKYESFKKDGGQIDSKAASSSETDFSKSYPCLEKISSKATPTISSDPVFDEQIPSGDLKSKSISLPVIKRPDDSEKYMELPHLYKMDNIEDLTSVKVTEEVNSDGTIETITTTISRISDTNEQQSSQILIQESPPIYSTIDPIREADETLSEDESLHSQEIHSEKKIIDEDKHSSTIMTTSIYEYNPSNTEKGQSHLEGTTAHSIPISMTQSIYGGFPDDEGDTSNIINSESITIPCEARRSSPDHTVQSEDKSKDPIKDWGKPLGLPLTDNTNTFNSLLFWNPLETWGKPFGLPSPGPPPSSNLQSQCRNNDSDGDIEVNLKPINNKVLHLKTTPNKPSTGREPSKTRDSSITRKTIRNGKQASPVYVDLAYIPHHGNPYYTNLEFFKRIRARYYVFSSTDPSKDVLNALLEAKKLWDNPDLEVTIIPTYDTDVLGYWITENEEILSNLKIDLAPSASRCTINLQDHDTSCSAYRLEF